MTPASSSYRCTRRPCDRAVGFPRYWLLRRDHFGMGLDDQHPDDIPMNLVYRSYHARLARIMDSGLLPHLDGLALVDPDCPPRHPPWPIDCNLEMRIHGSALALCGGMFRVLGNYVFVTVDPIEPCFIHRIDHPPRNTIRFEGDARLELPRPESPSRSRGPNTTSLLMGI